MPPFISDDELNAYVDGALGPRQAMEIAACLAVEPGEAARAEAFRAQRDALHAIFDHVLHQPIPERLHAVLRRHRTEASH